MSIDGLLRKGAEHVIYFLEKVDEVKKYVCKEARAFYEGLPSVRWVNLARKLSDKKEKLESQVDLKNYQIQQARSRILNLEESLKREGQVAKKAIKGAQGIAEKAVEKAAKWERAYELRDGLVERLKRDLSYYRRVINQMSNYDPQSLRKIVEAHNNDNVPIAIFNESGQLVYASNNMRNFFGIGFRRKKLSSLVRFDKKDGARIDGFYKNPDEEMMEVTAYIRRGRKEVQQNLLLSPFYYPKLDYKGVRSKDKKSLLPICVIPIPIKQEETEERKQELKKEFKKSVMGFLYSIRDLYKESTNPQPAI